MKHIPFNRVRGLSMVRAERGPGGAEVGAVLAELNGAFVDFRTRNEQRLTNLESAFNQQQEMVDALRIGPATGVNSAQRRGAAGLPVLPENVRAELHAAMRGMPSAAMTTQSGPDGGFTVPDVVDSTIDGILRSISPMRSLARVVTMREGKEWSKIIGRGGSQSAWVGEEETRSDTSSPTLGIVSITPEECYAIPSLTNHVIEDSGFDLESFVAEDVSGEFALLEGAAFVSGNGIKKPRGILSYTTTTEADSVRAFGKLQYVPTGQSGAFASSNPVDNLHDLLTALKPPYRVGATWTMNSATANVIRKFKDTTGRPLWTDSIVAGQPDRLLGYPVAFDESMPDIAAGSYSVAFGNFQRGYAIVDKPGIRLIVDRVTQKGWTKLYFSKRVGGGLVDSNAIKLLKFSAS